MIADVATWNATKLAELQGDALTVATEVTQKFPGVRILSAARDYKQQAADMAHNAVSQRDNPGAGPADRLKWIADTYWPTPVAQELQRWFEGNPTASEPDVSSAFANIMRGFSGHELRKLSKHIVMRERDEGDGTGPCSVDDRSDAVDFEYVPGQRDNALCLFLRERAGELGGRFLAVEGKEIRRHWQSK
jgi:hypothetical protein